MTLREAKFEVQQLGLVLTKTEDGEFRVNFRRGDERTAYYTSDLSDAVDTAYSMYYMAEERPTVDLMQLLKDRAARTKGNPYRPSDEQFAGEPFNGSTIGQAVYEAVYAILQQASRKLVERQELPITNIQDIATLIQDVTETMVDQRGKWSYRRNPEEQYGGVHVDIFSHNPAIVVAGNPGGTLIGKSVHKVFYEHVRQGKRVHEFEEDGTRMEGMSDGSIRIWHPDHPVWGRR